MSVASQGKSVGSGEVGKALRRKKHNLAKKGIMESNERKKSVHITVYIGN